jgi:tRNA (guanine-N7-)-methyltransferase
MGRNSRDNKRKAGDDAEADSQKRAAPAAASGPITAEGEMPQKRFYRSRAHCNPLSNNDGFK